MKTLELEIDDDTLMAVQRLASSTNRSVEELISQILRELATPSRPVGLFRDDADLLEEILQETMNDRETSQLRASGE